MPVMKSIGTAALCCALLAAGCRGGEDQCPQGSVTATPATIPEGLTETDLSVDVYIPWEVDGFVAVTELSAISGSIADPFARATTYACAHDIAGPVEVCVTTTYVDGDAASEALSEVPNVQARYEYIRPSHIRLPEPLDCSRTSCTVVVCPEEKNLCPEVSSLTIDPAAPIEVPEGETAAITVVADDPDANPEALVTTLTARHGTIADPNASETTYTCDPNIGGAIPICVEASDGACTTATVCEQVRCPGEPAENTCPIIRSTSADPDPIPPRQDASTIVVSAFDPDEFPEPLTIEWTSEGGGFEDPNAVETTFRCSKAGDVEVCVEVSDGDADCLELPDARSCMTIRCPGDIVPNVCPNLTVLSLNPSTILEGSNFTTVQTRGWDTDRKPFPLTLTLSAVFGRFDPDTIENMSCPEITLDCPHSANVVFQDAIYICDRPGEDEICVDATDGACTKTLCTNVDCPDDVP